MKHWLLTCLGVGVTLPAVAMDIGDGIKTGERVRLEKAQVSDNTDAIRIIQSSFERVMAARRLDTPVGLHITSNGEGGEAVLGQIVMVNEALAALPEDEREFEIAHEIGHIDLKHLDRMIDIFRHYVGTITDDHLIARTLNAHIDELSPELQGLEFEADAYGQALLQRIPGAVEGGIHTFQRNVFRRGDYSHPASRERMLKLQASLDTPRVAQAH